VKISELKPNQKVYIEVENNEQFAYLPTRLAEIGDGFVVIENPIRSGAIYPLRIGETVIVKFIHLNTFFGFSGQVIERENAPLAIAKLAVPDMEAESTMQRRQHVRIDVTVPFKLSILEGLRVVETVDLQTADLSTGGLAFFTKNRHFQGGQLVRVNLNLPGGEPIWTECLVVRAYSEKFGPEVRYRVALQFVQIEEKDRDHIAFFVFEKQREYIKKGWN
jgi:c-di-GMP-binding flagellar brake protein YcgR